MVVFFQPFLPRFETTGLSGTDSASLSELSLSPSTSNSSDFRFLVLSDVGAGVSGFGGGTDAREGVEEELMPAGRMGRGLGMDFRCGERVGISSGGGEVVGGEVAGVEVTGVEVAGVEVAGVEVVGVEGCTVEMSGSPVGSASTGGMTEAAD